ncbi:uncharacterized protein LOC108681045 [Hyalella azteca]|uniref:Uncharacterized protein LOC108681045 n=1 Tax=Hyalella azteca TaxID=294128 RepID=A0A8B7PHM9_HYAAZ|nr:uncharacterized protein LOC108681045 [Hyalella azteca]
MSANDWWNATPASASVVADDSNPDAATETANDDFLDKPNSTEALLPHSGNAKPADKFDENHFTNTALEPEPDTSIKPVASLSPSKPSTTDPDPGALGLSSSSPDAVDSTTPRYSVSRNRIPSSYSALNNGLLTPSRSPSPYPSSSPHHHPPRGPSLGNPHGPHISNPDKIPEWSTYHHEHTHGKVDRNSFKRNMTIAKGFLDISLLSANSNQLKHLLNFGDRSSPTFYLAQAGLITSLVLQLLTGVLLIVLERWNINKPHHAHWSLRLNNTTVCMVFFTLIINVFVSSLGVDVMINNVQGQIPLDIVGRSVNETM